MSGIQAAFFGVLARDAEAKTSKNNKPYLRFSVRCSDGEAAQFVSVLSFDPDAIGAAEKFTAGAAVYVEGRLSLDSWTDKDGAARKTLSVMAWHTRLPAIGRNRPRGKARHADGSAHAADELNDDIPF